MSESNTLPCLVATVKMRIVVVVGWSVLEKDYWLFIKHLCVRLITFHVFEECDVIFNLTLGFCNVVGLAHVR